MQIRQYTRIIDYIFITIATIILLFCWIRFYTHNITSALILASSIGIISGYLIYHIHYRHRLRTQHSAQSTQRIRDLDFQLSFAPPHTTADFFRQLLHLPASSDAYITLPNSTIVFPQYIHPVDHHTIRSIISQHPHCHDIIILCAQFDQSASTLCASIRNKNITILTTSQFFTQYSLDREYPMPHIIDTSTPKVTFRYVLSHILERKKAKTYLLLGLLLLFYTYFAPHPAYYLIFGTLLITMSILCKIYST